MRVVLAQCVFPHGRLPWLQARCAEQLALAMSMPQALAERRAQLDAQLAAARRELKTEQQRQKDAKRRTWRLTDWLKDVLLILYDVAGYDATPAQLYLEKAARERGWPPKTSAERTVVVEDAFVAAADGDANRLAGVVDLAHPTNLSAMKAAIKFHEEWRLAEWVRRPNQTRGVAPPTSLVLGRYDENVGQLPEVVRPAFAGCAAATKARMWARRWRQRWGARHGAIRAREDVPVQEIRDKVMNLLGLAGFVLGTVFGSDLGTVSGPRGVTKMSVSFFVFN